jgi:hypothetical protein
VILGTVPFRNRFNDFSSDATAQPLGWNLEPSASHAPSAPLPDDNGLAQYSNLRKCIQYTGLYPKNK